MSYSKEVLREASQDYSPRPARVDPSAKPLKVDSNFQPNRRLTDKEMSYVNEPFYRYSADPSYEANQRVNDVILGGTGSVGRDVEFDVRDRNISDPHLDQSLRVSKGLETLRSMINKPK
jgi:hypothetical protein